MNENQVHDEPRPFPNPAVVLSNGRLVEGLECVLEQMAKGRGQDYPCVLNISKDQP